MMGIVRTFFTRYRTQIGIVILWLTMLIIVRQVMVTNDLSFEDVVQQLQDTLGDTWYGPLLYIGVYMLRPVFLFPASLLTALAGNVYGLALGFVYGMIAGTASALVPYLAGRWFNKKDTVIEQVDEQTRFRRFIALMQENPFQAILTMRLLYFPYDTVSVVAGLLRINIVGFFTATAIGNVFGTFAFVGIGASIEGDLASGRLSLDPGVFIVSVLTLILSLGLSRYLNAKQKEELE
jgi:uncharacterized membrane protein YdjX (TVP38/TMEM64 family)